jgi:hypothetical protein
VVTNVGVGVDVEQLRGSEIDAEVPFSVVSLHATQARIVRQLQGNFHLARVCKCSYIKAFVLFVSHLSHDGRWGIT